MSAAPTCIAQNKKQLYRRAPFLLDLITNAKVKYKITTSFKVCLLVENGKVKVGLQNGTT